MTAQASHVLQCIEFDAQTNTCTQQAWLPAPSLLPPLEPAEVAALLSVTAVVFALAFGGKLLGRTTRD
ncbi:hypothetical protein [Pseudoxanthomonas mexicana]|uniref:hypothetical protein n=1 Tax=Pseudoxanthomonas mexicana TaxID=128785 RepID=UPI00398B9FA0